MQRNEPVARLLVKRERSKVVVRRREPDPTDAPRSQGGGGGFEQRPGDASSAMAGLHDERADFGGVAVAGDEPRQQAGRDVSVDGNDAVTLEGVHELPPARLRATAEVTIEDRLRPSEIRGRIERPDVDCQAGANCQNPDA